jgi:ribosome biogenesis SPOUT family RNA methylase Rps3
MSLQQRPQASAIYVVEHLDVELGSWSALEYKAIADESAAAGARFLLTSVPETLQLPQELACLDSLEVEHRSVEDIFAAQKDRVCLLDPAAPAELSPDDGEKFDIFLFGGILGMTTTIQRTAVWKTPPAWKSD